MVWGRRLLIGVKGVKTNSHGCGNAQQGGEEGQWHCIPANGVVKSISGLGLHAWPEGQPLLQGRSQRMLSHPWEERSLYQDCGWLFLDRGIDIGTQGWKEPALTNS